MAVTVYAMDTINNRTFQVDIHRLEPRFAFLRVLNTAKLDAMTRSIEHYGQQMPVIAVPFEEENRWLLIDGYLRLEAIRRLGTDLIWVDVWECSEKESLVSFLAGCQSRNWEAIEEAGMIRELCSRFGFSKGQIAKRIGRDISWVSRRLVLIDELPDDLLESVRQGHISTWVASRILVPLARANPDHAGCLAKHIVNEKLSTRDLNQFFQHYQQANKTVRERMMKSPMLFLKALHDREEEELAETLQAGPEGVWINDLRVVGHILKRLNKQVLTLFSPNQSFSEQQRLRAAFEKMKGHFACLETTLLRYQINDFQRNSAIHSDVEQTEHPVTGNQQNPQDIPQHGAPGIKKDRSQTPYKESPGPGFCPIVTGTLAAMPE